MVNIPNHAQFLNKVILQNDYQNMYMYSFFTHSVKTKTFQSLLLTYYNIISNTIYLCL